MNLKILRTIALIEGATLILLFLVAMPLKYQFDFPMAVSVMGPIHGMAFILYIGALVAALGTGLITIVKLVVGTVAAFVPFGSFVFEHFMLKDKAPAKITT
jgi:integral membrane protein